MQHLRTFKKPLKDCVSKIRATNITNSPGVYTGFVDELQKSYPQWYSQVYSEASPHCGLPCPHAPGCEEDAIDHGLQVQQSRVWQSG